MRPRSIFMNLSRGFVVDPSALRRRIESGHIAGAAIDVFPTEPKRQGDPFVSELRGLPNVILTPHIGGSTQEAQEDIGRFVAGKLRDYAAEGTTSLSVNFPGVRPGELGSEHRLAHVHSNVPGVLAEVNRLLASHGVNVDAQALSTHGVIGYLVTDITTDFPTDVLEQLHRMPETIRLRVLGASD
jgi:D-3-phosphoglycerate dehydrogenase